MRLERGSQSWVLLELDLKHGSHMWAHMVYQMHKRAAWRSFACVSVAWYFRQLCSFGALKNHQLFLLGSGTRVRLQQESPHQLLELQGKKSWGQALER